jgi:hypothetical protein
LQIKAGTPMWDLYNMENSPYTSGLFLWSLALRYQVTKDEEALRWATKAFGSLDLNFRMCVANGERGLLCKPYGMKFTKETSPDQQVAVIGGLWEYRKIVDEKTKRTIDEMIPAIADWWRTRDYKLTYFDNEGDWFYNEWARAQYGPVYVQMHVMAYHVTGDEVYRKEADRLLELIGPFRTRVDSARKKLAETGESGEACWPKNLYGFEYDPSRRKYLFLDWENTGAIWLAAAPAAWLYDHEPSLRPLLSHVIGNYYRVKINNLTPDLGCPYWSQLDLETNQSHPLVRPRITSKDPKDFIIGLNWTLFSYASNTLCGDIGGRVMNIALLAHHYAPDFSPGALNLAQRMLAKLDDQRLASFWDPTGHEFMPEDRWLTEVLSSETPSFAVLSYWQAKSWGIDLDETDAGHVKATASH